MLTPTEPRTERVTLRTGASELRRIEAAAAVAGVTRSEVFREGALELAKEVLRRAAEGERKGESGEEEAVPWAETAG